MTTSSESNASLEEQIVDLYPEYVLEAAGKEADRPEKEWYVALTLKSKRSDDKCDFDGEGPTFAKAIINLASKLDRFQSAPSTAT